MTTHHNFAPGVQPQSKWPFVLRSRYDAARAEADRQRERAEKAASDRDTAVFNRAQIGRQLAEADTANRRLAGRNKALAEQLEAAQIGSGFDAAQAKRAAARIANLRKAVLRARREAAEAPVKARAAVASELHRSEKARAALDEQCRTVQRCNEEQARELYELRHGGAA